MRKKQKLEDEKRKQSKGKAETSSTTSSLSAMMARMAKDTSTTDFTLVCGQLRRQVHSCVLANWSPYFEAAVKRWSQGEREILVESCNPEVIRLAVDYMYGIPLDKQRVEANPEVQEGLLELSRRLLMSDLKADVENVLMQSLNKNSLAQICDFAEEYQSQVLAEQCSVSTLPFSLWQST